MQLGFKLELSKIFILLGRHLCFLVGLSFHQHDMTPERHFTFKFYHFRQLFVHFLMPNVEPMTSRWPLCPLMAANLQRQFDYPPLFLPTQPQVMRYVWKKVRQAKVSGGVGWGRAEGQRDPSNFKGLRLDRKHTLPGGGKRRDHTNLIFLKKGKCTKWGGGGKLCVTPLLPGHPRLCPPLNSTPPVQIWLERSGKESPLVKEPCHDK